MTVLCWGELQTTNKKIGEMVTVYNHKLFRKQSGYILYPTSKLGVKVLYIFFHFLVT